LRGALAALGALFAVALWSWIAALRAPHSPGWQLRTAEWIRDNHGGWALDVVEWCVDSLRERHIDAVGPTALSKFPPPFAYGREGSFPTPAEPAPIPPLFGAPQPGEGQWRAIGWTVNGVPTLRVTTFRCDPEHPTLSVAVTRFTPELTRFVLVPGTKDPGGEWNWGGTIPDTERPTLLAAFNAGFRFGKTVGGIYAEGKVGRPLQKYGASLTIDRDGAIDIVSWHGRNTPPRNIVAVRQNLHLVVEKGAVVKHLESNAQARWGRLNHRLYIWRSGAGITADGALIYVSGNALTLASLATALQHAGAVRGMELDIHNQWPAFNVYQPASSSKREHIVATKLLPDMHHPAERYLTPDDRDFIAAFIRD
jgi:hypothetical protein